MKQSYFSISVSCMLLFSLLSGCNIINPSEPIPSYIHINQVDFHCDETTQGSSSAKISDIWVYIDDQLQGCYELPLTFPVLAEGTHKIIIKPGIKVNGISATRAPYPFYQQYTETITLTAGETITLHPTTTYVGGATFSWLENFDNGPGTLINSPSGTDTSLVPISTSGSNPDVYEGTGSVAAYLDNNRTFCEFICNPSKVLPAGGSPVFLEFNYKCNFNFTVGMFAHNSASSVKTGILNFRPTATWNKAYLYLTPTIQATPGSTDYTIFFGMLNSLHSDSVAFLLDNIKLVHY